ncbi:hypothetical protein TNCV_4117831 [Trichonephila clavipes]|nr:hypothetical protein TNCV_4117831 [Trichonephila clavipes]
MIKQGRYARFWSNGPKTRLRVVPDFHKRILFSDEARFWLNGYVNINKTAAFGVKLIHKCMSKHRTSRKTDCFGALFMGWNHWNPSKTMKATTLQSMVVIGIEP